MSYHYLIWIFTIYFMVDNVNSLSTAEELLLQEAMGLNCTAYIKLLNNTNTPLAANSSAILLLAKWNCTGITGAQSCAAGLYSAPGSVACDLICPVNKYCPGNGSAIACSPGGYSLGGSSSPSCTQCPVGSYCIGGIKYTCPAGYLSLTGSSACSIPCPAGNYCPQLPYPILCPSTTYSLSAAKFNCTTCEPGYRCPTVYNHVFCPPNTWSSPGQTTSCDLPCPTGVVCPGNGKMECTVCAPGVFTVKACSTSGDTICNTTCPPGMFGAFYTNGFCQNCPVGTYLDHYGASNCDSCNTGHYSNTTGTITCPSCPTGSSTSANSGFVECKKVCYPHIHIFSQNTYMITLIHILLYSI